MSDARTLRAPAVPSIIPVVGPFVRRLIGLGLPLGPNVLLTVRGRRSGTLHTFPVALLELDGRRYVQSPFGEVNWVRNLRAAGDAVLSRGRRSEPVAAVEMPPEDVGRVIYDGLAPYRRRRVLHPMLRFLGFDPAASREDYVAAARLHPTFELIARA